MTIAGLKFIFSSLYLIQDSHLIDMLRMLKDGYRKKTVQDRVNYGIQLKNALEEFTEDFLPHMKEEEEVTVSNTSNILHGLMASRAHPSFGMTPTFF